METATLEAETFYPLWVARDRRYDGKVFAGVRTTGVYCRPICPAKTALKKNMTFFPSAAAAEAAGFRPCLRCRPETSPTTPAWHGTSATVSRALRFISSGWVTENGLESLSLRLGLGQRQMRRLFEKHLGASPSAILRTRQLDLARKLLDETGLPISEVAFASGFSSLRRFNDTFKTRFRCTPSQARRRTRWRGNSSLSQAGFLTLRLAYRLPLDWRSLIEFLSARAITGVEWCQRKTYARTCMFESGPSWFSLGPSKSPGCLDLRVTPLSAPDLIRLVSKVRAMFDLDADPKIISDDLGRDPWLKSVVKLHSGLRIPGAWDGFELGVRAILGQQISVAAARKLASRMVDFFGHKIMLSSQAPLTHLFPDPKILREANLERCGVIKARAQSIRIFADYVATGKLTFDQDYFQFKKTISSIPGIGPWTADYIAIRVLREPNILLKTDLVVRRELNELKAKVTPGGRTPGGKWAPWCSYATFYLWKRAEIRRKGKQNEKKKLKKT